MTQIFKPWTNRIVRYLAPALAIVGGSIVFFFWYFGSPKFTDIGYRPLQPIPYSHQLHAGKLGIDCRYCHIAVERSAHATVPSTQTCMNCHKLLLATSAKLALVQESWTMNQPIFWHRVHKIPDYAYFNHSVHVRVAIGCYDCHGDITKMEVVAQQQPLSMSWCLDCHRHPTPHLRPKAELTVMKQPTTVWTPANTNKINPPVDCSGCHR